MIFVLGLFTFVLVLNCLFLILLVLVQLPKKDAGAGMAFGAGTADALFGAGSGNLLTKITGGAAGCMLALCLLLGLMQGYVHKESNGTDFTNLVEQKQRQMTTPAPLVPANAPTAPAKTVTPEAGGLVPTSTNAAK